MANEDLSDVWSIILKECAIDDKRELRNMTVPALAHVATYRALCRSVRDGAARLVTPYDATIQFAPNGRTRVPVAFCGGVHFAEKRFDRGLSIIRDRATSQMFAVSHGEAEMRNNFLHIHTTAWVYKVRRMYPLARLAQLLSGHTSFASQRLRDLLRVALPPKSADGVRWRHIGLSRKERKTPSSHEHRGVVHKNQLRGREWNGLPGSFTLHEDDFISHKIEMFDYAKKGADFVMVSCVEGGVVNDVVRMPKRHNWCGNDHGKLGIRSPSPFVPLSHDGDDVHCLSRALGWDCAPRVAEGPGWLVSFLAHGDDAWPRAMPTSNIPMADIRHMAHLATHGTAPRRTT